MKDRLFSGPDVEEALALAAANLGLPRAELRYVVLDPGSAGGRGLKPTPARIAVLLQEPSAPRAGGPRPAPETRGEDGPTAPADPRAALRETIRAVADSAGLDVGVQIEEDADVMTVSLNGGDTSFFLGSDGRGEVLRALEHLLLRLYGAALRPRALRLTCEGFRERRDAALAAEAHRLADAVRADAQTRTLEPMNAYERRVIHVALQGEAGVTSYSEGEGPARRVRIAPARAEASPPEAPDAGE